MPIPRWKWLEKVGATEEAEKEKAKPIPKPTVIEKTVSSTTTARRRRLEHTQEHKDTGGPQPTIAQVIQDFKSGITPVERQIIDKAPKPSGPSITSGQQLRIQAVKEIGGGIKQYKEIDTGATYVYESGEQISGRKLKQQMGRDIQQYLLGVTKIKPGMYVESGGQHYHVTGGTRYLIEHAEPREKADFISSFGKTGYEGLPSDFVGPVLPPIITTSKKAYESLVPGEKEEYGFRFQPFREEPVETWQYYPGGERYITEHKEDVMQRYIEQVGGLEHVPTDMFKYASTGGIWSGKLHTDPEFKRSQAWDILTKTKPEMREQYFGVLPAPARWYSSAFHATAAAAVWPITLPQTGVKLITGGKTMVLPDIAEELQKYHPGGPSGGISTVIGEGLERAPWMPFGIGGHPTDAGERFLKDPISGGFATVGEIFGLYLGGKALHVGKATLKRGVHFSVADPSIEYIRSGIAKMPGFYSKFKTFRPSPTLEKLGGTAFFKKAYGWAAKGKELDFSMTSWAPLSLARKGYWGLQRKIGLAKYVPEEEVWDPLALMYRNVKFAEARGPGEMIRIAQATRGISQAKGDLLFLHARGAYGPGILKVGKGAPLHELPILSYSAYGRGSPRFLRIGFAWKEPYSSGTSLFPHLHMPTGVVTRFESLYRLPEWARHSYEKTAKLMGGETRWDFYTTRMKNVFKLPERGFKDISVDWSVYFKKPFSRLKGQPSGPYTVLATKAEMGGPEIEYMLWGGAKLKRFIPDIKYYTTYKGHAVPLSYYDVMQKGMPTSSSGLIEVAKAKTSERAKELFSSSYYYGPTTSVISPGYLLSQALAPYHIPSSVPSYLSPLSFSIPSPSRSTSKPSSPSSLPSIVSIPSYLSGSQPSYPSKPSSPLSPLSSLSSPSIPSIPSIPSSPSIVSEPSYPSVPSSPPVVSGPSYYPLPLSSPRIPSGHYKKKKKWLEIDGARKRVHPVTLLKIPKIPFQEVNI